MNKILLYSLVGLVVLGVILTLGQVWGMMMSWAVFTKAIITIGILVLLLAFLLVIKSDLGDHKKMKDENYLD